MSNLYVFKGGKLISRDPQKTIQNKPTVIHYNHIIRQIPEIHCNCKEETQRITKQFQSQLLEKEHQISILVNRIAQKETDIEKLQLEITSLRNFQNTPLCKEQNYFPIDDIGWDGMNKSLNSTTVSCFSLCDLSSKDSSLKFKGQQVKKTEKQMEQCFKKTTNLMIQIEGIMKKKRNYEFHNSILVDDSIIEELQNSEEKSQEDTQQVEMEDTFCFQQSEYNDFDSLDMTTFESIQNFGQNENENSFYSKLLKDSIILKNTVLQMREQALQQMKEVQNYYQKQLRISYEELQKQRLKNSLSQNTKTISNEMNKKGRQALAELDQNQNYNFSISEKDNFLIFQLDGQQDENFVA